MNKAVIKILVFIVTVTVLIGGSYIWTQIQSKNVIIDNPFDQEITVKIDSTEYKIPGSTSQKTTLEYGDHEIFLNGESIGKINHPQKSFTQFIVQIDKIFNYQAPIINPLKAPYVIETDIYGGTETNSIKPSIYNNLYIFPMWDYDLDSRTPDSISLRRGQKTATRKKVWRPMDFIKEYKSEGITLEELKENATEQPTLTF